LSRITLSQRIRLCRNLPGTRSWGNAQLADALREARPASEECEVTFAPGISATQRAHILDRDDLFCAICGVAPGDIDDLTGYEVKFNVRAIGSKDIGGKDELESFRTLCSTCNQGAKNITTEKPTALWLLSQVRRAGQDEQRAVLEWLRKKFKSDNV
jgi:hypothetical protein